VILINHLNVTTMILKKGCLEFSLNDNLDCETFILMDEKGNNIEEISYSVIEKFVKDIFTKFNLDFSDHRTQGFLLWNEKETKLELEHFQSPDWDDYKELIYSFTEPIKFVI